MKPYIDCKKNLKHIYVYIYIYKCVNQTCSSVRNPSSPCTAGANEGRRASRAASSPPDSLSLTHTTLTEALDPHRSPKEPRGTDTN